MRHALHVMLAATVLAGGLAVLPQQPPGREPGRLETMAVEPWRAAPERARVTVFPWLLGQREGPSRGPAMRVYVNPEMLARARMPMYRPPQGADYPILIRVMPEEFLPRGYRRRLGGARGNQEKFRDMGSRAARPRADKTH